MVRAYVKARDQDEASSIRDKARKSRFSQLGHHVLSAISRRSLVVVRSADKTTLDCFFSARRNNFLTKGCLCCSARFAKGKWLRDAILRYS